MFGTYTIIGVVIFLLMLGFIIIRPYGISEALASAVGALLMILCGFISPADASSVLLGNWNVYGFFLGLMTISALADQAGVFDFMAYRAGNWAKGSGLRLYLAVFITGVSITAFLSNDTTALILTPVVYALVTRLRLPAITFVLACKFIADTASFLLPVSNPINVMVLNSFGGGLTQFLRYMLLPSFVCIGLNIAFFVWLFRRDLRVRFNIDDLPKMELPHRQHFFFTMVALAVIAMSYVAASALQFPVSIVALGGSAVLLVGAVRYRRLDAGRLGREISWPIFIFISGMFIAVRAVENLGLTATLGRILLEAAGNSPLLAILLTSIGTALGSNLINNVPMALVTVPVLGAVQADPALVYAMILGADLGPNMTVVGSLAAMIWVLILRRKGMEISMLQYFKLGITIVPVMIVAGSILIWLKL